MLASSPRWLRAFAWCLLISFTSGACANASAALGLVLCLGEDGHVAVETARGPDCADLDAHPPRHDDTAPAEARAAAHCSDCVDIAIAAAPGAAPAAKADVVTAGVQPDAQPAFLPYAPAPVRPCRLVRRHGPLPVRADRVPDLTLLAHRTDVLLV